MTSLDDFVAVPLPVDLYAALAQRQPHGVSSLLEHIARDFLDRTAEDFAAAYPGPRAGVQWDAVFLPAGTEVRTKYKGVVKVAAVGDGQIHWDGKLYESMSQLASSMRGDTSNNAWKVLEVKRPTDSSWKPADVLRH